MGAARLNLVDELAVQPGGRATGVLRTGHRRARRSRGVERRRAVHDRRIRDSKHRGDEGQQRPIGHACGGAFELMTGWLHGEAAKVANEMRKDCSRRCRAQ